MSSSSNSSNNNNQNKNINLRPCVYGCGIQIYWNSSVMSIGKSLQRRNIFVLIEATNLQELLQHWEQTESLHHQIHQNHTITTLMLEKEHHMPVFQVNNNLN